MIISASRRTDIPAFYAEWFENRVRAGYCTVPNPFNRKQVSFVSLKPDDVDVIVFWTRNPAPLLPVLRYLDQIKLRYYFQYTLMDNPREIDTKAPSLRASLKTFQNLSEQIGPDKVIWRYDPIVFSNATPVAFHEDTFERLASALHGYTNRVVISILDSYPKTLKRIANLRKQGIDVQTGFGHSDNNLAQLMTFMVRTALEHDLEIYSCAEVLNLSQFGIRPGKCIDNEFINKVFGLTVRRTKDPNQRAECGCIASKDIGVYDTCLFGCQYCYATSSFERAYANHDSHDPKSPSLIGHYDALPTKDTQPKLF